MGYAKLNFATTVTTAQAMYDIVRCLNGTNTSTANLIYANTANSEIVNTLNENWSVLYGNVADTTTAYVVTSPCVTASKTHRVKLQMGNGSSWDTSAAFTTTGAGIGLNTIETATSATSVTNPTFYSTSTGANGMGRYLIKTDATNTSIYIHWSAKHILFYGLSSNAVGTMYMGSFEYPETSLTQYTNTAPVIQYNNTYTANTTYVTTTTVGTDTTLGIIFQGIKIYTPNNNTTNGVYHIPTGGFGTVPVTDFDAVQTIDATGNNVYPIVPFYWSNPAIGLPIMNISELTGVYRMSRVASVPEGLFTSGADTYVWLPLASTINGGVGLTQAGIALLKK
jgi:hypothetical protein